MLEDEHREICFLDDPTTPHPQQQYLLITEEELLDLLSSADAHDYQWTKQTEQTIRSRPAPLTQNDNGDCLVICQHCGKVTQVQCMEAAQAREEEREKMMRIVFDQIKKDSGNLKYCIGSGLDLMRHTTKSLRTGGEPR